jgi:hypothetical protein
LINGGAATAVIAFLAKEHVDPIVYKLVPWCLAAYAAGVLASSIALFCEMMNADYWNYYWYFRSYERDNKAADNCEIIADHWHVGYFFAFSAAILAFLLGSRLMVCALLQITPAIPTVLPG